MINSYGLNYGQKNRIRRLAEAGEDPQRIAQHLKCQPHLVRNYLATVGEARQVAAVEHPNDSDGFGPLPGSAEWEKLSPGARGGLTKKRNNAERRNADPNYSTV